MAKIRQRVKVTVKRRVKKGVGNKTLRVCNVCRGLGYVNKK